jgi:hypothetical protein
MRLILSTDRRCPLVVLSMLLVLGASVEARAQQVVVEQTRIIVNGTVAFGTGSDVIAERSTPLLNEVASALKANPRFTQLRVEGHTDNRGAELTNYRLSEARALAVKRYLIAHGVDAARIHAEGFGPERPIADNNTEAGRRRNRRVAFIVVEIEGRRVVADREPLAKLSARTNQVEARKPTQERWRDAAVGLGLFRAWRVQSRDRSAAEVTFRDASQIGMRENTLVIIYGAIAERTKRFEAKAELETGALRSRLAELAGEAPSTLAIATPSAQTDLRPGSSLVSVDEARTSRIAHHRGPPVRVWGRTASGDRGARGVELKPGFGSKVAEGGDPSPPTPLPPAPVWSDESDLTAFRASTGADGRTPPVRLALPAVAEGSTLRVEIARQASGADVARARSVDEASADIDGLPDGDYHVRLSAIDADAFEGPTSAPRRLRVRSLPLAAPAADVPPRLVLGARASLADDVRCGPSPDALANVLDLRRLGAQTLHCAIADAGGATSGALTLVAVTVVLPEQGIISGPSGGLVPGADNTLTITGLEADALRLRTPEGALVDVARAEGDQWRGSLAVPADAPSPYPLTLLDGDEVLGVEALALAAPEPSATDASATDASATHASANPGPAAAARESSPAASAGEEPTASEGSSAAVADAAAPGFTLSPLWGLAAAVGGVGAFVIGAAVYGLLSEPAVLGVEVPSAVLLGTSASFVLLGVVALGSGVGLAGASYLLSE